MAAGDTVFVRSSNPAYNGLVWTDPPSASVKNAGSLPALIFHRGHNVKCTTNLFMMNEMLHIAHQWIRLVVLRLKK